MRRTSGFLDSMLDRRLTADRLGTRAETTSGLHWVRRDAHCRKVLPSLFECLVKEGLTETQARLTSEERFCLLQNVADDRSGRAARWGVLAIISSEAAIERMGRQLGHVSRGDSGFLLRSSDETIPASLSCLEESECSVRLTSQALGHQSEGCLCLLFKAYA